MSRKTSDYGNLILKQEIEEDEIKDYVQKKSELKDDIDRMSNEIKELKSKRKEAGKHIPFSELPTGERFQELKKSGKQFIDTIKMIAYRAETALVNILRGNILKNDEARSIVRQIFTTGADIEPDNEKAVLKVLIHNMTSPRNNRYVEELCEVLNESETTFPGTNLRLIFDLVSNNNHAVP